MKLATFVRSGAQQAEIGVVTEAGVVPAPSDGAFAGLDMIGLIERWDELKGEVARWSQAGAALPLASVRLLAPIPRPGKMLCMGLNYADHVAESSQETPPNQIWFCKQTTAAHGPYEPIDLPKASSRVDYEVELVAIVGKKGRHVPKDKAADLLFGYCVGNDVSARDWQFKSAQWMIGKSFDTHGPFGPWITTADEVGDPHALDISCKVNGETRQSSNTKNLIFDVFDQVVELSQAMTLEPGDVIYTGTPGGVGVAMKPPSFLKPGDTVTCEISKLGKIEGVMTPERA
ncbi:MAG: fumarylacetoacetate hydrolase family protein [Phenylobacterium sp.]|uniref:fumarylacetoacetate hydrolase family protein n=1 Tax=Phenylobacterium sp. TaxID=1871053 RepID=UPI002735231F|nr:fumarylacetoacetate hydrolase family protein [Phenylobacterium sp.]MDP3174122.1 fumarylacetoacetate hydrolase family protein [Phenylobacterium sp.]